MADAALSSMLRLLLENIASTISKEVQLTRGVNIELNKLSKTLMRIQAMLTDAEEREIKEAAVKLWLRDLKDVAYDIEDILDEFATHVLQKKLRGAPSNMAKQVCKHLFLNTPKGVILKCKIAHRIKEVRERLDGIAKERDAYHLIERGEHAQSDSIELQTSSLIDQSNVFGRDDEKEKIIKLLISDECSASNTSVISIVGMGGIGKTTLAQLVYNDETVKMNFELRIWVYVSSADFDARRITKKIIESITGSAFELMDLDPLQTALEERLCARKFLLVLDDVWIENRGNWDLLKIPFRVGAPGSKIIVTTRSEIVSSVMGTISQTRLKHLSSHDSWSLFAQYAFPQERLHTQQHLEKIGREIVNNCNGLPLAIKTLGCLLRSKEDENEWEGILKSEIWDLPKNQSNILPALALSYHHLPTQVKRCFAYCSIFPKGYGYEKEKLVRLWMGEGFIQMMETKQMEDTGGEYFNYLVCNSFLQYSHADWEDRPMYKMHYLIHDLAEYVSANECFRVESEESCNLVEKARHSSLLCDKIDLNIFQRFYKCKSLRTLLLFTVDQSFPSTIGSPVELPKGVFPKLRCLRVLDSSSISITRLPNTISSLKHLRFLDLSLYQIKRLPKSIASLCNLQTLTLRNCHELLELPTNMSNLVNLRHLELHTGKSSSYSSLLSMPPGIGKLTCLQTLSTFVVGKKPGCKIEELKHMENLGGSICIAKLENVTNMAAAKDAELKRKKRLQKLELQWSTLAGVEIAEDVLTGLEPHNNLKKLRIFQYNGIRIPSWVGQPSFTNLESIHLQDCRNCKSLPTLGQLPMLKDLYIHSMPNVQHVNHEFCGSGTIKGFRYLEMLEFNDLCAWETWSGVEEGNFACLRELEVADCTKLKELPYLPPTLTALSIRNCLGLTVTPELKNLADLELHRCDEGILTSLTSYTSLSSLRISGFPRLKTLTKVFSESMIKLKRLYISYLDELTSFSEEAAQWDLPVLERLVISHCPQLKSVPKQLKNLGTLREFEISDCSQLSSILELSLPSTLQHLRILHCPLLKEQCQKEEGEDSCKFLQIPYVEIDGVKISHNGRCSHRT